MQWNLDDNLWTRNIVPKSRQHGVTTWACIRGLDTALFRKNTSCGIVAHTKDDASKFFRDKVLYAYENLPDWLKADVEIVRRDMNGTLEFSNGSKIEVSVSHRGGTLQFLHISEYGVMCAKSPERAEEVRSGALNTIQPDCIVVIESTGYGEYNDFAVRCKKALALDRQIKAGVGKLTMLDYKHHFFAWWMDVRNQMDPDGIMFTKADDDYFTSVEAGMHCELAPRQRAWYVKKREEQGDTMFREHPSTPEEVFRASVEGSYYGNLLSKADKEGRICDLPIVPNIPVNTFWDIGHSDATGIWFHQQVGAWHHFIDYYENEGETASHYARILRERGYLYGKHYLPHDVEVEDWSHPEHLTRKQALEGLGVKPIVVVARIHDVTEGIDMTREMLPLCRFDRTRCGEDPPGSGRGGLPALRMYRKRYNEKTMSYSDEPLHDWASTAADALRQFGQGYTSPSMRREKDGRRAGVHNWRTA